MMISTLLFGTVGVVVGVVAGVVAGQPQTEIKFQDVNVFATTDVHAWIAGGDMAVPSESPSLDADYGDLVSFITLAKEQAKMQGKDVFLFDNGDVVDGTGVSNIDDDHCSHLLPLYRMVPYDALNCGNHELYDNRTMEHFKSSGYIDSWGGRYLTSNLVNATTNAYLGNTHTVIHGPVSGVRLLVFGFMYDMTTSQGKCDAVNVISVEETVKSAWFVSTLKKEGRTVDAIVILAHMDADEPLIDAITTAIRSHLPHIPIQVIAGHSHARKERAIDGRTNVFEPGNFFNTLGFASFPLLPATDLNGNVTFTNTDIDTNVAVLASSLGFKTISSFKGTALSNRIKDTQEQLGLSEVLGCLTRTYDGMDLVNLYMNDMATGFLFTPPQNKSQWFIQSTGSLRYNLYQGNMTVDDTYKVLPFKDAFSVIHGVKGSVLKAVFEELNSPHHHHTLDTPPLYGLWPRRSNVSFGYPPNASFGYPPNLPGYACTDANPMTEASFDVIMGAFDVATITNAINIAAGTKHTHVPGTFRAGFTDTLMLQAWAQASLKPCTTN